MKVKSLKKTTIRICIPAAAVGQKVPFASSWIQNIQSFILHNYRILNWEDFSVGILYSEPIHATTKERIRKAGRCATKEYRREQ